MSAFWIISAGQRLEIDGKIRPSRYTMLAESLTKRGHAVTHWAPTFCHSSKTFRARDSVEVQISPNRRARLLSSGSYHEHLSTQRVIFHLRFAVTLQKHLRREEPPDLILCSMPDPLACASAALYARSKHIPFVIDVRDLWPDAAYAMQKNLLRALVRLLVYPAALLNRIAFSKTDAVVAISADYLSWGLDYAHRDETAKDKVFVLGYPQSRDLVKCSAFGRRRALRCCFIGSMTRHFSLDDVIGAAKVLPEVQFILCGDGPLKKDLVEAARGMENVKFTGWIEGEQIATILAEADIGLAPYAEGAPMSLPNKPFEYMAAGLPVISSLEGPLEEVLGKYKCGKCYKSGDVERLASLIRLCQNKPGVVREMSRNARQTFRERFSAAKVYPRMAEHLEGLFSESPTGRR